MPESEKSSRSRPPQIGCKLPAAMAKELDDYAAELSLSRTTFGRLLVQRELNSPRLSAALVAKAAGVVGTAGETTRVTVHLEDRRLKSAYQEHVRSRGLGSDEAAAALFVTELEERFLIGLFGWQGNRP